MITNILLTTDFSPASQAALPFARAFAKLFSATIHILHVADATPAQGYFIPDLKPDEDDDAVLGKLKMFVEPEKFQSIPHTFRIRRGVVWDEVLDAVRDLKIDLLILGDAGASELKRMLLGSVTEHILRKAACPVLTVGPQVRRANLAAGQTSTILHPTDFSQASSMALSHAVNLARLTHARLILMHAVEDKKEGVERDRAETDRRLSALLKEYPDLTSESIVLSGLASDAILSQEADLIVMGTRGGIAAIHDSRTCAHRVINSAECPVLTVRSEM